MANLIKKIKNYKWFLSETKPVCLSPFSSLKVHEDNRWNGIFTTSKDKTVMNYQPPVINHKLYILNYSSAAACYILMHAGDASLII